MSKPIFGIQGGKGSFNEQALIDYTQRHRITEFETQYLFTTEKVLKEIDRGVVNFGQFALHNSTGGLVQESLQAIAQHTFEIIEEFGIPITHCLMKRKEIPFAKIKTFMAHPQVFKQCQKNLAKHYPEINLVSGQGVLIDHAKAAEQLSLGMIDPHTAVLGPEVLARLYNLEIVAKDLQDNPDNLTTFLMVKKR